ncbi:hypothetical protein PVAND_008346 [Polypedilum vanderplanki]|uniref:Chitin-binding type-2 domain-containing protein n=1 Tax=Polypedilum vanderplanki TaxID=319348 RepID=A0A9J6C9H1_POLVA|nr:hypothetical protein PVAND_008346 [Polypedilum vanderplanki]
MGNKTIFIITISTLIVSTIAKFCTTSRDDTLYIYPSANNCSSFILCHHNEEIEMSCLQSSLFMFTDERVCIDECSETSQMKTANAKTLQYNYNTDYLIFPAENEPIRTVICPSHGSTIAAIPQECNDYIECVDGIGTRKKCDIGSKFSPSLFHCEPEDESDCKVGSDNKKKMKGSYVRKCRTEKGNSALVFATDNCSEFKKCANLMAWTISCANGTSFSKESRTCEWENEVKCEH